MLKKLLQSNRACAAIALSFGLVATIAAGLISYADAAATAISDGVIRFHVLANSDSYSDQQLKFKVRDAVIEYLTPKLEGIESVPESRRVLSSNLTEIERVAAAVIEGEGYAYPVRAELTADVFPTKEYDGAKFPAGVYETLRVIIGGGEGKNWWCVMFPPMCLSQADPSFGESADAALKTTLGSDAYGVVRSGGTVYKAKFKIIEIFQMLRGNKK